MKLIIEDDEGRKTVVPFVREEITIGRQEGNTIRLTERNVSRHHARLVRQNGHVLVEDLGSYNGIRINGERISGQTPVQDGDLIQIGDYDLAIQTEAAAQLAAEQAARRAETTEAETEADAPIIRPDMDLSETLPEPDGEEDTSPTAKQQEGARRQSTSVIHASQVQAERPTRQLVELDPEEAPRLFVLNTTYAGREFACIRTELRVGRTDDNDIAIDHRSLSRTHVKVVREDNGEWRVLDMQSANGMKVNGDPYAQASLRSGDIIELGHVKMKFLAPGETFRFVPGAYDDAPRSGRDRKKLIPVVVAGVVVLLFGLVLAIPSVRALFGGKSTAQVDSPPGPTPSDVPPPKPDKPDKPDTTTGKAPTPTNPETTPAVKVAAVDEKLKSARAFVENREFERAVDVLESIQGVDAAHAKELDTLLAQAKLEISAKKYITQAGKELTAGHADQARELLAKADGTVAFATEYEQLKAKLETPQPRNGKQGRTVNASGKDKPPGGEQAQTLFDEGFSHFKKKQYNEAVASFTRCLEIDNSYARCHMMLGSIYATLRQPEKGAQHYREFLKLAPDDPKADNVRRILEQYEQTHR